MYKKHVAISIGFLLFFGAISYGQLTEVALDPVTITASPNPISLSKTGRNILVINGDKIKKLPINSIDELLRYLPGIEVQARGPMGSQSDFVLRGGTFQQVLVILDGLRVNDPLTGHFNSYIPITPSEIDRIEILKGASSAIYGTEAVGGVIHIISKSFAKKEGVDISSGDGHFMAGQYGLINGASSVFIRKGKNAFSAGVLSNNATGQRQRGIDGFFHNNTYSVSARHQFSDHWQLAIRSSFDDRSFAAQNFYTTFLSDTAAEKVKTFWNQIKVDFQKSKSVFSAQVGYKKANDHYLFNPHSIANENSSQLMQALTTYAYHLDEKTVLTGGAQFQKRKIASNDRGNHTVDQSAVFVLLEREVVKGFYINPAVRLDWNSRSGAEFVPQLNASYHINQWQFRGSAGKTIREADFTERYNNYNKNMVRSGTIGNPDLALERSFSYEGGADLFIKNVAKISATYFQRNQKDLIDYVATSYNDMPRKENLIPGGTFALAKNISKVTTSGFETDLQIIKSINNNNQIWSTVGLVLISSKSSEAAPSFYITSHAKFLFNYNVLFSSKYINVAVNGLYKVRNAKSAPAINAAITKDYFLMNAKAAFFVVPKKVSIVAQVDNVWNRNYSDLLGSVMPRRWWMIGINFNL
ncbi:MAG: TonB-dependent receptor [Chitinophagaceae bacterium]